MPEAPTPFITPISAHVHWDDTKAQWTIKASRQERIGTKYKEWEGLLEKATTFAEVLLLLLQFWAMTASTGPIGANVGSLVSLGTLLASGDVDPTFEVPEAPHDPTYEGTTLEGDEYDGTDYSTPGLEWGQTPA